MTDHFTTEGPPSYTAAVGASAPPVDDVKAPPFSSDPYPTQPQPPYPSQPQPYPPSYNPQPQGAYPTQAYSPYVQQTQTNNVVMVTHQPGGVATGTAVGIKPDNYLVLSIVSIFCFCWLFGLIALLYSLQVDSAWARGDTRTAQSSSRSARGWNIASIVGGVISIVVVIVISVASNTLRYSAYNNY